MSESRQFFGNTGKQLIYPLTTPKSPPTLSPTITASPTEFVARCVVSRKSAGNHFLDVVSAIDEGWIVAKYSRNLRRLECTDCADMNFADCRDIECADQKACAGSTFTTSGRFADFYQVRCLEEESCQGATFNSIDVITCLGESSCISSLNDAVFEDVGAVNCSGEGACLGAVFGSNSNDTKSVNCSGKDSCQYVEAFAVSKMVCSGNQSCRSGKFYGATAALECQGNQACLKSVLTGKKKLRCGTSKSCKNLEWK